LRGVYSSNLQLLQLALKSVNRPVASLSLGQLGGLDWGAKGAENETTKASMRVGNAEAAGGIPFPSRLRVFGGAS